MKLTVSMVNQQTLAQPIEGSTPVVENEAVSREAAEAMALTMVSTHTAACWAMLHSTVAWLDDTSTIGPARAVASPVAAAQLASAARDAAGGGARPQAGPEENNLPALLELLRRLA